MIQFAAFIFFTGLVGYISWRKTHRDDHESATGYFLAGRSLGWIVIAGSLLLTNLSTEQLVGLNGGAFNNGMQVMAWEVWSSIAIVLMALVFLPRYLKGGVATVSAFLERRYSKAVGTAVSLMLLLSLLTNLLPFVIYSGALFTKFDLRVGGDLCGLAVALQVRDEIGEPIGLHRRYRAQAGLVAIDRRQHGELRRRDTGEGDLWDLVWVDRGGLWHR